MSGIERFNRAETTRGTSREIRGGTETGRDTRRFREIELDLRRLSIAGKFAIMVGQILYIDVGRLLLFSIASDREKDRLETHTRVQASRLYGVNKQ